MKKVGLIGTCFGPTASAFLVNIRAREAGLAAQEVHPSFRFDSVLAAAVGGIGGAGNGGSGTPPYVDGGVGNVLSSSAAGNAFRHDAVSSSAACGDGCGISGVPSDGDGGSPMRGPAVPRARCGD